MTQEKNTLTHVGDQHLRVGGRGCCDAVLRQVGAVGGHEDGGLQGAGPVGARHGAVELDPSAVIHLISLGYC